MFANQGPKGELIPHSPCASYRSTPGAHHLTDPPLQTIPPTDPPFRPSLSQIHPCRLSLSQIHPCSPSFPQVHPWTRPVTHPAHDSWRRAQIKYFHFSTGTSIRSQGSSISSAFFLSSFFQLMLAKKNWCKSLQELSLKEKQKHLGRQYFSVDAFWRFSFIFQIPERVVCFQIRSYGNHCDNLRCLPLVTDFSYVFSFIFIFVSLFFFFLLCVHCDKCRQSRVCHRSREERLRGGGTRWRRIVLNSAAHSADKKIALPGSSEKCN